MPKMKIELEPTPTPTIEIEPEPATEPEIDLSGDISPFNYQMILADLSPERAADIRAMAPTPDNLAVIINSFFTPTQLRQISYPDLGKFPYEQRKRMAGDTSLILFGVVQNGLELWNQLHGQIVTDPEASWQSKACAWYWRQTVNEFGVHQNRNLGRYGAPWFIRVTMDRILEQLQTV